MCARDYGAKCRNPGDYNVPNTIFGQLSWCCSRGYCPTYAWSDPLKICTPYPSLAPTAVAPTQPATSLLVTANGKLYTEYNITSSSFRDLVCGGPAADSKLEQQAIAAAVKNAQVEAQTKQASNAGLFLIGFVCGLVILNHYLVMGTVLQTRRWWDGFTNKGKSKSMQIDMEMSNPPTHMTPLDTSSK